MWRNKERKLHVFWVFRYRIRCMSGQNMQMWSQCMPSMYSIQTWSILSVFSIDKYKRWLQLRLDFNSFVISGPSTITDSVTKTLIGSVSILGLNYGTHWDKNDCEVSVIASCGWKSCINSNTMSHRFVHRYQSQWTNSTQNLRYKYRRT